MIKYANFCPVLKKEHISDIILKYTFRAKDISSSAKPGQFVQIKINSGHDPLWPRPFSIFDINESDGEISIIFKIAGRGTNLLAKKKAGDSVHIFGPLGSGFSLPGNSQKIIMAAGGVGLPPLYLLSRFSIENGLPPESIVFISGARTKNDLFKCEELAKLNVDLRYCTDDGSYGEKGTVIDLLKNILKKNIDISVYSCGPSAMLKRVDELLVDNNIAGYLSLEELMPCGYGICSGCAVKVNPPDNRGPTDDNRDYHLKRVCVDGPVFKAGEVIWE